MNNTLQLVLVDQNPEIGVDFTEPMSIPLEIAPVLIGPQGPKGDTVTPEEVVATLPVLDVFGVDGNRICTLYGELAS